ncbi:MBL fold metallo-hydrolase [Blastococcus saxobsidens]|uniref:Adenosylcobinamide kinase/adenosylcobinamide-phosphate guanylyltransferase n=1 Tax=Blastococcus saxobsidens TaxID=138336 RepID=A0A4Q7Y5T7_9ACTN|nr:MBL fold metallo-hydrolase [Blastococcus saxobsidens]RZU31269.1 adenosylcobinamide kinase/adenosylcobinamide-phosphate guanylyltransferase [Blastococcus saxobsidens]
MRVTLLGTGAADGWPNPWCEGPSCADARLRGELRRPTSALVDGVLLLDLSPAPPPVEVSLARVHTVLVTHDHPDHCAPLSLLARQWVRRSQPLAVAGPAPALEAVRPWLAPDDPVDLVPVAPGTALERSGYRVRALHAAHEVPAVLYDVTGPDGARLLYATDTGPLPEATLEATRGAAYDLVLLEETFGTVTGHGTGHLDLATFPAQLDRLTDVGAVTPGTDVVAVHLGHHNPPAAELTGVLARLGARLLADGDSVTTRCAAAVPGA